MKYSKAEIGRIFIVRLEDGDILHESIEYLAEKENIRLASVTLVGGADKGSRLVTGPEDGRSESIKPTHAVLNGVNEMLGVGTLCRNETGSVVLHMHTANGRKDKAIVGCVREGVKVWHIGEAVITEIVGPESVRKKDIATGFELLEP